MMLIFIIFVLFFLFNYWEISIKYLNFDKSFPAFYKRRHEEPFFDSSPRFFIYDWQVSMSTKLQIIKCFS